jgi:uncharacterized protein (DUF58 family)
VTSYLPTWRLAIVAIGATAVGFVLPVGLAGLLLVANGIVVALALLDAFLAPSPASIGVGREIAGTLTVGQTAEVRWAVRNTADRAVRIAVADELAPSLHASSRRFRTSLPARSLATAVATIRPSRRGRFDIDEVVVRCEGPMGLMFRQQARSLPALLRVMPRLPSRDDAERLVTQAKVLNSGLQTARGRGGGTEFDQLREYTPDDEFRRVDWAATARAGRPIVRQYRAEQNQTIVCLLDNGRVMAGTVAGVPRVEHAMDACIGVSTVAAAIGDRCGLVAFDRGIRALVPPAAGRQQLGVMTEVLFDLEPALAESDYTGVFTDTVRRYRKRTLLVLLTDLVEQSVGETLLPAVPLLTRRHVLVVAAVRDPAIVDWADATVTDEEVLYRRLAATQTLEDRRRARIRLEAQGAIVIDAPAGELATRLVDSYLRIKATGRL